MASVSVWATTRFVALAAGDVIPAVDVSDTTQSAHGSVDTITVTNFFGTIPVPVIVTSASANALAVGLTGATNSAFLVDASTALQVAGLKVTGAVTGGTVAVVTTDSGAATNLTVNAKGTGTIGIGSVSTGRVTITPVCTITGALTLSAALTYGGVTLSNAVTGTGNMVLSAGPTLTGTVVLTGTTITGTPTWSSSQAITLSTAAQPNVTSLGTLTSLTMSGAIIGAATADIGSTTRFRDLFLDRNIDATGTLTIGSTAKISASSTGSASLQVGPTAPSANAEGRMAFITSNTVKNWRVSANDITAACFEITPSTANGGTSFTTPAFTLTAAGALSAITNLTSNKLTGAGSAPGIAAGAAAGASPTVTLTGTDSAGKIDITAGSGPSGTTLATITFATAYAVAPYIQITPASGGAQVLQSTSGCGVASVGTTTWILQTTTLPTNGVQYVFYYHVIA